MQVFSCEVNDELTVGSNIQVAVLEICPDYVRLGITSGGEEPSYREETLYIGGDDESVESWMSDSTLELQLS